MFEHPAVLDEYAVDPPQGAGLHPRHETRHRAAPQSPCATRPADCGLPLGGHQGGHLQTDGTAGFERHECPARRTGHDLDQVVLAEQTRQGGTGSTALELELGEDGADVAERPAGPGTRTDPHAPRPGGRVRQTHAGGIHGRHGNGDQPGLVAVRARQHAMQEQRDGRNASAFLETRHHQGDTSSAHGHVLQPPKDALTVFIRPRKRTTVAVVDRLPGNSRLAWGV